MDRYRGGTQKTRCMFRTMIGTAGAPGRSMRACQLDTSWLLYQVDIDRRYFGDRYFHDAGPVSVNVDASEVARDVHPITLDSQRMGRGPAAYDVVRSLFIAHVARILSMLAALTRFANTSR